MQGTADIKRFFALISSLFALQEGSPTVPNTSTNIDELLNEIRCLNKRNNFVNILSAIRSATYVTSEQGFTGKSGYCILLLNYDTIVLHFEDETQALNFMRDTVEDCRIPVEVFTKATKAFNAQRNIWFGN